MAKLTKQARDKLKKSQFALPNTREYPINDEAHVLAAKRLAWHRPSMKKKIDEKADKFLNKLKSNTRVKGVNKIRKMNRIKNK